ncbi:ROK family protein [Actinomyces sp. oral taxon 171]|uniref:ROK family protein n=1 Tax=Actinomyces sp. oral taxon 171 TaxID=706438 RepID=UPI0001F6236D|nr:ROK family protein [Actinomyces sp. oral taxon 171]EFW27628.1 ROK family protein [Actinomyces sp. oral taxon 171 str. F0337]
MGSPADLAERLHREEGVVAIGVDVSADGITAVVADGGGSVISSLERPVPKECRSNNAHRLAQEIGSAIEALCTGVADDPSGEASGAAALVVGVCVPGVVDEDEGRVRRSETLGLQDVPLASLVRQSLSSWVTGPSGLSGGLEVMLYQDAGCGAWAESQWGAAGRDCLYLAVGERISSAVLLGGALVLGEGWAGQVGRILVPDPDWSGERARLEDVASVGAMVRRRTAGMVDDSAGFLDSGDSFSGAVAATSRSRDDASHEPSTQCASGLKALLGAMRSGDREARRVWDTGLDSLAELVAHGVGLLGPLDIVVNSELMRADEVVFLEPLRRRVADLVGALPAPRLVAARLGVSAPALGAAGRALADWK